MIDKIKIKKAVDEYKAERPSDPNHYAHFYNDTQYEEEREKYCAKYETVFHEFVTACKEINTLLFVLYIPSQESSRKVSRAFFERLVRKYTIPYLDVTEPLSIYEPETVYLLPEDTHLSRFSNQVLARLLKDFITPYINHRSGVQYTSRPALLGDLKPNDNSIWTIKEELPYRVITNRQGLRRKEEVSFPRSSELTRVLCIGDSVTFCPYLSNHDCYPQLLEKSIDGVEVINAGNAGYTICDEFSYLMERGKYVEPDIIILQVLDNDLYGFSPHKQKEFCRGGKFCMKKK
ncbi:MAG: SGNH/GDSL hydrolase family protein [Candidatus Omnitrophica bacterium]|nr:SGNH/GDSL hydrolase family protein [Candidatus Omnitrophota bacterium]